MNKWKIVFVCLASILLSYLFAFPKISTTPFNLDELAWINDGRFYVYLVNGKLNKFNFNIPDNESIGWSKQGYGSEDQPALGKLLYGFWIIHFFDAHFYQKDYSYENQVFAQQQLNGAQITALAQYLPAQTISAILSARILAWGTYTLLLVIFSLISLKLFRSLWM